MNNPCTSSKLSSKCLQCKKAFVCCNWIQCPNSICFKCQDKSDSIKEDPLIKTNEELFPFLFSVEPRLNKY
jgi:hypothetical protein